MPETTVRVRMYNVGFGDAFLVTVTNGDTCWRMLVDCGVHAQGRAKIDGRSRSILETVETIKADLIAEPDADMPCRNGGRPHLDVIVATHRHADHVNGFAEDAWDDVEVDEVWVPFVEDPSDPVAVDLRTAQAESAAALHRAALALSASGKLPAPVGRLATDGGAANPAAGPRAVVQERANTRLLDAVAAAEHLADNSLFEGPNLAAMERLIGDNGFANHPKVRFLPDTDPEKNRIETTVPGARVCVLGPSRDKADLKRMNPPKKDHWLAYAKALDPKITSDPKPLFARSYVVPRDQKKAVIGTRTLAKALDLAKLGAEADALLAAAAVLENSVNNTSVFFVLDVNGRRLLFVGDSQEGAWRHVLDDPSSREQLKNLIFYKIGHHGSHNATPRRFVEEILNKQEPVYAMLPWGNVEAWKKTIPKRALIEALQAKSAHIVAASDPIEDPIVAVDADKRWIQLTFTIP